MVILDQIRPELVPAVWPHMVEFFRSAHRRVPTIEQQPDTIRERAMLQHCDLWAIYEKDSPLPLLGAASTVIYGRTIRIESFGGREFARWGPEVLARFETMAKGNGIARIEMRGRIGWQRLFKTYRPLHVTIGKHL